MTNMGTVDRAVRIVVGVALLSLVLVGPRSPWGLLGLLPLLTGVAGSCPLYRPFRIDTRAPAGQRRDGRTSR